MSSRENYIEYWRKNRRLRKLVTTADSVFVRIDEKDFFEILKFETVMEAMVYFRYSHLPKLLEDSGRAVHMRAYGLRTRLESCGCYLQHSGTRLVDILDEMILVDKIDQRSIDTFTTLFNWTSRFAFEGSGRYPQRIAALGSIGEFLNSSVFEDSFRRAESTAMKKFIRLHSLLSTGEFTANDKCHLHLATSFIKWAEDPFNQMDISDD